MKNVPVLFWILLIVAAGAALYYRNQYKTELAKSTGSTGRNFSGGTTPATTKTFSQMMAQVSK